MALYTQGCESRRATLPPAGFSMQKGILPTLTEQHSRASPVSRGASKPTPPIVCQAVWAPERGTPPPPVGDLALTLTGCMQHLGEQPCALLGQSRRTGQCCGRRSTGGLTNSDPTQAQIQGSEFPHPNIHPIYELLEHLKRPILQIQNFRVSVTQDNNRRCETSPCMDPVLMLQQKPQTTLVTDCNEHL